MLKVETLMPAARDRLVTIETDALLVDAAKLLDGPQRNLVAVCDDGGRLAGVVTKTDVVSRIGNCTGFSCTMEVSAVMTREVAFCRPDDWLHEVWSVIKARGLKNLPVVDQGLRPVGILHARDAVEALLQDVQYEEQLLRDYVSCVGYR